jgi:hypothetical protein
MAAPPSVDLQSLTHSLIWRTRSVVLAGYTAVILWIALVWLAHAGCAQLKRRAQALPPGGLPDTPLAARSEQERQVVDAFQAVIDQLRRLWRLMTACVAAAAFTVVTTLVTAGALRAAFIAYAPEHAGEYPASAVLLFGALFAIFQIAIGLPMAISWRTRARDVVERVYPWRLDVGRGETWADDRARLEALLHLDVALIRNPLTVLSIFAPLVTSVLAVFIPQLASR